MWYRACAGLVGIVAILAIAANLSGCGHRVRPPDSPQVAAARARVARDARNSRAWFDLGGALAEDGRLGEAVAAERRSSQLAPNEPGPLVMVAYHSARAGNAKAAAAALAECENLLKHSHLPPIGLGDRLADVGECYQFIRHYADAERCYTASIRVYPLNSRPHLGLAFVASAAGRHSQARLIYRKIISQARDQDTVACAHRGIGLDAEATGDIGLAKKEYRLALKAEPGDRWTQKHLARMEGR